MLDIESWQSGHKRESSGNEVPVAESDDKKASRDKKISHREERGTISSGNMPNNTRNTYNTY